MPLDVTLTASVLETSPERVKVNTIWLAAASAPDASVALTLTVGVVTLSSLRMVTWPASSPIVSPPGLESTT